MTEDVSVGTTSVREFLDGKLARYKIPTRVVVIDELPQTATGKIRTTDMRAYAETLRVPTSPAEQTPTGHLH